MSANYKHRGESLAGYSPPPHEHRWFYMCCDCGVEYAGDAVTDAPRTLREHIERLRDEWRIRIASCEVTNYAEVSIELDAALAAATPPERTLRELVLAMREDCRGLEQVAKADEQMYMRDGAKTDEACAHNRRVLYAGFCEKLTAALAAATPPQSRSSRRQIVLNWVMGEDDLTREDGWWTTSDGIASVDTLLEALDAAAQRDRQGGKK